MKATTVLCLAFAGLLLLTPAFSTAQNVEVTGYVGGQINGGVDFANTITTLGTFNRLEVQNGVNYGVILGYLLGEHGGVEFQWNRNEAGTNAQRVAGPSVKVFNLTSNQYMGNFLFHFSPKETKFRPFAFVGLGGNNLSSDRSNLSSKTKFIWALGAGAKYNMSHHVGLRAQFRYAPTYLTTTSNGGYFCDPFYGCWVAGNSHYLNEFDFTGGITFRF
jgi:opacity protein-like surface antigen